MYSITIASTTVYILFSRYTSTPWDNNFWMNLDYQLVAMVAHVCGAHFTSLLCVEISLTNQK